MRPPFRKRTTATTVEFYLRHPENLLLVKRERDGGVLVCATADNLSAQQQVAFLRYLDAEGFVSVAFEPSGWLPDLLSVREGPPVRWIVDQTWPEVDPVYVRHLRRLCWCLAGTMMVCIAFVVALICC